MVKSIKQKKQYTWQQKVNYHTFRANSNASERKKLYSKEWLNGFFDRNKNNLSVAKNKLLNRRRNKLPFQSYDVILAGYKNGLTTRIEKDKK